MGKMCTEAEGTYVSIVPENTGRKRGFIPYSLLFQKSMSK
jgi:hypothetical protein